MMSNYIIIRIVVTAVMIAVFIAPERRVPPGINYLDNTGKNNEQSEQSQTVEKSKTLEPVFSANVIQKINHGKNLKKWFNMIELCMAIFAYDPRAHVFLPTWVTWAATRSKGSGAWACDVTRPWVRHARHSAWKISSWHCANWTLHCIAPYCGRSTWALCPFHKLWS